MTPRTCALAATAALSMLPGGAGQARTSSRAIGISEREWSIAVFRPTITPGVARFNVTNRGEDSHNLEIRAPDGAVLATSDELRPGDHVTLPAQLAQRGTYTLLCTIPGHAERGMLAKLRVVRKRTLRAADDQHGARSVV